MFVNIAVAIMFKKSRLMFEACSFKLTGLSPLCLLKNCFFFGCCMLVFIGWYRNKITKISLWYIYDKKILYFLFCLENKTRRIITPPKIYKILRGPKRAFAKINYVSVFLMSALRKLRCLSLKTCFNILYIFEIRKSGIFFFYISFHDYFIKYYPP